MAEQQQDNLLAISWYDSAWIPVLNQTNVMDYFAEATNPFYDRTCNNEIVKMQRLNTDQLLNMTGLEYKLLHALEPILYVIRKSHRHSPTQETALADYHIIAGIVYQSPDLSSVVNSRLANTLCHVQSAFEEAKSYSHYHPSKGYWWQFKDFEEKDKKSGKEKKEETSSIFQRQRVDVLLSELAKNYPPKIVQPPVHDKPDETAPPRDIKTEAPIKTEVKGDEKSSKPPPEKRQRIR